jgi:hypothetical protein
LIEPASFELYREQPFTFDVILADDEPTSVLGQSDLILTIGDTAVATINANGTGNAKGGGKTTLTADYIGFTAEAVVTVHDGTLVGIEVIPAFIRLQSGQTHQIRVTGRLSTGEQLDLTRGYQGTRYTYDSASFSVSEDGLIRANTAGGGDVTVTHGMFSGVVRVEIDSTPSFVQLVIEPPALSLEFGEQRQLGVFGVDAAGMRTDLIASFPAFPVTFSSSDPSIATVNETALVSALRRVGFTTVTAKLGDLSAGTQVQVRPPASELIDLRVEPEFTQIAEGEQVPIRVTGFYADGSIADLTPGATGTTYQSSNPMGFSVNGNGLIQGIFSGANGFVSVQHAGFERLVFVEVVGGKLIGLRVNPPTLDMIVGSAVQLQVLAVYEDGSVVDVTFGGGVVYTPPRDGIINVTPDGFVIAIFPGAGTLIVSFQGFDAFIPVTVIDQMGITGIFISPPFISVPEGQTTNVIVFAQLVDGSIIDITFDAALSVTTDQPRIAAYLGFGTVEGRLEGFTVLRATYVGFTAEADIEVTSTMSTLVAIALSIPGQMGVGETAPYMVVGFYSDGSTRDLTFDPQTMVSSSNRVVVDAFGGIAFAGQVGEAIITATHLGFTAQVRVRVVMVNDPVTGLFFSPPSLSINIGSPGFASLLAFHQSGSVTDVTSDPSVLYSTTGPISAFVNGGILQVDGFASGQGQVFASYQGFSALLGVTVGGMNQVVGIDIVAPASLNVGEMATFFVVAFFSDGSFGDITFDPGTVITGSNPMILEVTTPNLRGVSAGQATITATYQGFTDQVTIQVGNDPIVSLVFVPSSLSLLVGQQAMAQVIATYQSGRVVNVTFDPGLNVNTSGPVIIGPGPGGNIVITPTGPGVASLTAFFEGLVAVLTINIQGTTVVGIQIFAPAQIQLGFSDAYSVIATFADGSTQDITFDPGVTLTIQDPSILDASFGALTGLRVGVTTLTASYQGFTDVVTVEVINNDVLVGLQWAPGQLTIPTVGGSGTAQLFAFYSLGGTVDVTADPGTTYSVTGPITTTLVAGGLEVTGTAAGNGQVLGTFMGLSAGLPVTVGNAPTLVRIRIVPSPVQVDEGDSIQLQVIGVYSDGSEAPVTGAQFLNFDPSIADVSPAGLVTGIQAGTGGALVLYGNFAEFVQIDVISVNGPTITSINPSGILVGSPATTLTVTGTGFSIGDAVFLSGSQLMTTFVSPTRLSAQIPSFMLTFPFTYDVQVRGMNGRSNIVPLLVGEPPNVASFSPSSVFQGSSIDVTIVGTGLANLSYSAGGGLTVTQVASSADGTWVRVRVTAAAGAAPGTVTITLSNPLGMDTIQMTVVATTGLPDLIVSSGQTVMLSGTNSYGTVTVNTGGRIVGTGLATLAIIASNGITIRGTIDVSGHPGEQGFTTPAAGGDAGPGGAGGGGGGDGNATTPAVGGAGSPPGFDAQPGFGAGTPGGDGGGEGAGGGGAFGCGHGAGGGGLGGNGGNGGGDFGPGSGGFGGFAGGRGSSFGDGTGGGGGSTCGGSSGGGGGGGGGGLILQVAPGGTILVDGAITADGGEGGDGFQNTGGGGGGSGGRIEILAPSGVITVNDTISARGGRGGDTDFGDTGGGGGGGIILIDATGGTTNVALGFLNTDGGEAGVSLGGAFPGDQGTQGLITVTP